MNSPNLEAGKFIVSNDEYPLNRLKVKYVYCHFVNTSKLTRKMLI